MSTVSKETHTAAGAAKSPSRTDHHPDGHIVQFYETDAFLVDSVCGYIAAGLGAGDAGIVIATPAHRQAIEARLLADGLDLDAARARDAYIAQDAAETLARFMAGGSLDPERFAQVIGGILAGAARDGRHVRVFGEMVALLWANRDAAGAIRLEELWNDLRETTPHAFTLCCAYPMEGFAGEAHGQAFAEICARHTRVNPDEGYSEPTDPDERRRSIALLRQKARSLDAETAERKAAEQRVRVSERLYRRLFETSADGILMIDSAAQTITDANPAAVDLFGLTRERLLGARLWQIGLFPDRETAQEALREAREEQPLRAEALPLWSEDGRVRYVELVANRFQASGHDVIQCNLRDVTERRQLEQRTREALAALLAIAAAAVETPGAADGAARQEESPRHNLPHRLAELTCGVLGCRRVGITAVEPGTERLRAVAVVGLAPEEEPGWWAEQRAAEAREARLGEGADPADVARFRAGEIFILDMTAPPYRDLPNPYGVVTTLVAPMRVGEQIAGVLSLDYGGHTPHAFSDEEIGLAGAVAQLGALVLDRERLLAARAAAEAEALALSEANRRMDEFLGIASHELRTPLTALMANLQMLARPPRQTPPGPDASRPRRANDDGSREQVLLDRSRRQVERIARLIGDMIDLARIREGKLELRPEPCDLIAIVREEVELQRQAHPERTIIFAPPVSASVPVHADPDRIGQVVTNYLTNAIKYSDAERLVAVRVEADGGGGGDGGDGKVARVSVRDEGPGIPAAEQDHVWEMFHRVPGVEVLSGSGVGLGLGLHISRSIVERHGGAVGIESTPGEGSTFWFSLPLDSPRD